MKHRTFRRVLTAAACLLLALPAWGAGTEPAPPFPRPSAAVMAEARTLIRDGRFDEALAILRPLARGRRIEASVLFHLGLASIGAADLPGVTEEARDALLDEAIAVFRKMLIDRPDLVRVRLELARAFFLKGEDGLAKDHFERVLAGNPPSGVALNVGRFLAQIRARKRWSVRVGAALAPDSNVTARSGERTILLDTQFGRLPFTYQGDKPRSGIGIALWAGGEYQYPVNERWRLRAGGDVSRREYRSSEFDRMTLSARLGPRWLIGRASEASLLASARQSWLADREDFRDLGIRVEGRHRLSRRTTLDIGASRHERRYDETAHLDGPLDDFSAGLGWAAMPTLRLDAAAGWGRQRTERARERHTSRWGRIGATLLLPRGFTVGGAFTLRRTDYPADWFPFVLGGGARRDTTRSIRLSVHNRAFTVAGFGPQLWVAREERKSNAQLHGYERVFGELRFVRLF